MEITHGNLINFIKLKCKQRHFETEIWNQCIMPWLSEIISQNTPEYNKTPTTTENTKSKSTQSDLPPRYVKIGRRNKSFRTIQSFVQPQSLKNTSMAKPNRSVRSSSNLSEKLDQEIQLKNGESDSLRYEEPEQGNQRPIPQTRTNKKTNPVNLWSNKAATIGRTKNVRLIPASHRKRNDTPSNNTKEKDSKNEKDKALTDEKATIKGKQLRHYPSQSSRTILYSGHRKKLNRKKLIRYTPKKYYKGSLPNFMDFRTQQSNEEKMICPIIPTTSLMTSFYIFRIVQQRRDHYSTPPIIIP